MQVGIVILGRWWERFEMGGGFVLSMRGGGGGGLLRRGRSVIDLFFFFFSFVVYLILGELGGGNVLMSVAMWYSYKIN